jgi:hypothetical protein
MDTMTMLHQGQARGDGAVEGGGDGARGGGGAAAGGGGGAVADGAGCAPRAGAGAGASGTASLRCRGTGSAAGPVIGHPLMTGDRQSSWSLRPWRATGRRWRGCWRQGPTRTPRCLGGRSRGSCSRTPRCVRWQRSAAWRRCGCCWTAARARAAAAAGNHGLSPLMAAAWRGDREATLSL